MAITESKQKALDNALKIMQKKYGKEFINVMKDVVITDIESFSTGSLAVDEILGVGGVPKGRVIEIYGPESSGKTTLALQIMAQAQKNGDMVSFIDVEQAMSLKYAQALGINIDELIFSQPTTGEEALESVELLCQSGAVGVIVVDSVAALQTQAESDGDIGDAHIGQVARLMSQALRKIVAAAHKTNTTVIFINQIRDKIGAMGYGEKTTTTGGNALKFYASVRIDVRRIGSIKVKEEVVGNQVKIMTKKNKVAAPSREATVEIYFGKGISPYAEVVDMGVKLDIIDKSGAWFSYESTKLGQGRAGVIERLETDIPLYEEIRGKVVAKLKEAKIGFTSESSEPADEE